MTKTRKDLTGDRSGRLVLTEYAGKIKNNHYYYASCDCGTEVLVTTSNFKTGSTKSCGCLKKEKAAELGKSRLKHGGMRKTGSSNSRGTPEYKAWKQMKMLSPYSSDFDDFQDFFKCLGWRPSDDHFLSRRDVREPHSKINSYWKHPNETNDRRNLTLDTAFGFDIRTVANSATAQADGTGEETQRSLDWQEASGRCDPDAIQEGSTDESRERVNPLLSSSSRTMAGVTQ